MPDLICDTSPIQYLYQLELLHILPALADHVIVPPAVTEELAAGRALGVRLPDQSALDWIDVRRPASELALPLITDLGPGETEVLMLAYDVPSALDSGYPKDAAGRWRSDHPSPRVSRRAAIWASASSRIPASEAYTRS